MDEGDRTKLEQAWCMVQVILQYLEMTGSLKGNQLKDPRHVRDLFHNDVIHHVVEHVENGTFMAFLNESHPDSIERVDNLDFEIGTGTVYDEPPVADPEPSGPVSVLLSKEDKAGGNLTFGVDGVPYAGDHLTVKYFPDGVIGFGDKVNVTPTHLGVWDKIGVQGTQSIAYDHKDWRGLPYTLTFSGKDKISLPRGILIGNKTVSNSRVYHSWYPDDERVYARSLKGPIRALNNRGGKGPVVTCASFGYKIAWTECAQAKPVV